MSWVTKWYAILLEGVEVFISAWFDRYVLVKQVSEELVYLMYARTHVSWHTQPVIRRYRHEKFTHTSHSIACAKYEWDHYCSFSCNYYVYSYISACYVYSYISTCFESCLSMNAYTACQFYSFVELYCWKFYWFCLYNRKYLSEIFFSFWRYLYDIKSFGHKLIFRYTS